MVGLLTLLTHLGWKISYVKISFMLLHYRLWNISVFFKECFWFVDLLSAIFCRKLFSVEVHFMPFPYQILLNVHGLKDRWCVVSQVGLVESGNYLPSAQCHISGGLYILSDTAVRTSNLASLVSFFIKGCVWFIYCLQLSTENFVSVKISFVLL